MTEPRVALISIARTTFDIKLAEAITKTVRKSVEKLPVSLIGPDQLITDLEGATQAAKLLISDPPDLLLILQATFADSGMVMGLVELIDAPLLLWAIPEDHTGGRLRLNSLCGINLAAHALTRAGHSYQHLFTAPDDPTIADKLIPLAKAGQVRNVLRQSRLGRIGENPDGFETCLVDLELVQKTFGLEVVQIGLAEELFPLAESIDANQIDAIHSELNRKTSGLDKLDPAAVRGTLSAYAALEQLAHERNLHGYALRCWPEFFTQKGCAACGALSMLSDDLIPSSCEVDVNGTITQLILQSISKEPAFGTDIVSLDENIDALVIWHCGSAPLSMADPKGQIQGTIHSNREMPLLFDFTLKPGPVTVARLTESTGAYRLVVGRGEVIRGPKSFSGTSGLIRFNRPARDVLNTILTEGLEHHISMTYGDHIETLCAFAKLLGIQPLHLTE